MEIELSPQERASLVRLAAAALDGFVNLTRAATELLKECTALAKEARQEKDRGNRPQ
jgi:hypothetical protein